jgi:hypothetical protein
MTQLLERARVVAPPPPVIKPPITRKPWTPWLWGLGLLLAAVAIGFAVANLFIGDEVAYYDRAAEHGDHTGFVQDLRTDLSPGYVGQDAHLDPDVALSLWVEARPAPVFGSGYPADYGTDSLYLPVEARPAPVFGSGYPAGYGAEKMYLPVNARPVTLPPFGSGYPANYGSDSLYLPDAARQVRPIFGSGYPATYGSEGMYLPDAARQVRPIFGSGYPATYGSEGMYLPSYTRAPPATEIDPADVKFFANAPASTIDPADRKFFANAPEAGG